MARPSDLTSEVEEAYAAAKEVDERATPPPNTANRRSYDRARRVQALTWHLAGLTFDDIGERLEISPSGARELVLRSLERAENVKVEEQRAVENARLDRAQAAIWPGVLQGDIKSIGTFLRISEQRSRLNGLYAPTKIDLAVSVKHEMEQALHQLETLVLHGEVIEDGPGDSRDLHRADRQVEGTVVEGEQRGGGPGDHEPDRADLPEVQDPDGDRAAGAA